MYYRKITQESVKYLQSMKIGPANSKNIPHLHVCILIMKKQIDCCTFILFIYLGARESNSSKKRIQGLAL